LKHIHKDDPENFETQGTRNGRGRLGSEYSAKAYQYFLSVHIGLSKADAEQERGGCITTLRGIVTMKIDIEEWKQTDVLEVTLTSPSISCVSSRAVVSVPCLIRTCAVSSEGAHIFCRSKVKAVKWDSTCSFALPASILQCGISLDKVSLCIKEQRQLSIALDGTSQSFSPRTGAISCKAGLQA
jgi:hypothetical protein